MSDFPELDLQGIPPAEIKWVNAGYGYNLNNRESMGFDVCVIPHGANAVHGWVQVAVCDSLERAEDIKIHIDNLAAIARRLIGSDAQ